MNAIDFRKALHDRLASRADRVVLRILVHPAAVPVELTGRDVLERSVAVAGRHAKAPPGSGVLLLLPHSAELFLLHIGLVLTGRVPAILAWPTSRIDPRKYQRNLLHQLRNLPAAELLTSPSLAQRLRPVLPFDVSGVEIPANDRVDKILDFDVAPEDTAGARAARAATGSGLPADALFLQFSGGTTGAQKCVVVTAPMLETQLGLLAGSLDFGPADSVVSWLPLYHDMGLIACLWLPLWTGAPSLHFAAQDWLMEPGLLFRLMERYRGTYCWLPNFAFSYLAGQSARMQAVSLAHVRAWINCSEPVRRKSVDGFAAAFASFGVTAQQCQASYAMAENVFAVTQTAPGSAPPAVARSAVKGDAKQAWALPFGMVEDVYLSSGKPLPGMQVRVRNKQGELSGDRESGQIEILTPCLFQGYWGSGGFSSQTLSPDGWYATGDYGFTSGGELFVIGRTKDMVIVGGQNVFPEDVETLANSVEGVYAGRVVAFGVEDSRQGTENLAVVAEMRGGFDSEAAKRIEREISRAVLSGVGIAPRWVRVTQEHWIVKSTAGKISRRETRLRFLEEKEPARQPEAVETR